MRVDLDFETELVLQRALETGHFANREEALAHAVRLLALEGEDDWLLRNREAISAALDESFAAKERGDFVSPEQATAMLNERRDARAREAA